MGPQSFLGLISVGYLNTLLLLSVSEHIIEHLQPKSKDPEILDHKPDTYNPQWCYWGPYIYEHILEKAFIFLLNIVPILGKIFDRIVFKALGINEKNT